MNISTLCLIITWVGTALFALGCILIASVYLKTANSPEGMVENAFKEWKFDNLLKKSYYISKGVTALLAVPIMLLGPILEIFSKTKKQDTLFQSYSHH